MSLHLDARQRAMLQEMGIHVWQTAPAPRPESAVAWVADAAVDTTPPTPSATLAAPPPAPARVPPPVAPPPALATGAPIHSPHTVPILHPPRQLYPATAANATVPPHLGNAWLIVAEGRADADPLAGDAGTLLHNMLHALQLHRHPQVFFCGAELSGGPIATHAGPETVLAQALAQIQPAMVLLMGRLAARVALGRTEPLGQLRAQPHSVAGYPAIVTYDAPYWLRQGKYKAAAWADLCHARQLVGVHTPHRG